MDISKLAAPFPPDVVSWRVGPTTKNKDKGMALAYIDARDVQDRLTEVCGPFGWQCKHEVSGDKRVTCHIGIKCPDTGEWIWRSDGAGESEMDGEKGSYSDSFKRAAVKWGVGRYLYDIDSPWMPIAQQGRSYVLTPESLQRLAGMLAKGMPVQQPKQEADKHADPDAYMRWALDQIAHLPTKDDLATWWTGEAQARRDHGLTQEHVDTLKAAIAKRFPAEPKASAAGYAIGSDRDPNAPPRQSISERAAPRHPELDGDQIPF